MKKQKTRRFKRETTPLFEALKLAKKVVDPKEIERLNNLYGKPGTRGNWYVLPEEE